MPYCPDCGVEIGNAPVCPLCGARNPRSQAAAESNCPDVNESNHPSQRQGFLGKAAEAESLTVFEKRKIAWEVLSVAFSIAIVALSLINILVAGKLSWSLYPVSAFFFVWVLATAILIMGETSRLRYVLAILDVPIFLLALGLFTGDLSWAWRLAVPISLFSEIVIAGVALSVKSAKRQGLNILAYILVGAALICLGVETFVDLFAFGKISLGWSAITAIALIPIACFLIYLHYRVAKTTNLHRLFKL